MTLRQLVRQFREALPACLIEDAPDFPSRGVMLDISRDKVPTLETLFRLVDELAELKINHLELYTEHTFAYRHHREVWQHASPMTAEEVRELDAFCRERHVELVPNQNCFGHMHRWLDLPRYRDLAECPDGFTYPWGDKRDGPYSLNPLDPRSLALVEEIFAELLPNFSSRKCNVGCDETFDLGQGRSKEECDRRGKGRVYFEFLMKIHALMQRHGRTMHFWGDIVLHHPELIPELPRDVMPLVWGYEADHPFDTQCQQFAAAGFPFFVCPGTSAWNTIAGRTDNALGNLRSAAECGLRHGGVGYLNTEWGDNGHLQPYVISLLPYAAGAAYAWGYEANREADLPARLDLHVFRDAAGVMGRLVYDLGNVHLETGHTLFNATSLFRLISQVDIANLQAAMPPEALERTRRRLREILAPLARARMERDDADLIRHELETAAALLECGLDRGLDVDPAQRFPRLRAVTAEYRRQWLARNRPGGLDDSALLLEKRATA
jgi:hexosaminidase